MITKNDCMTLLVKLEDDGLNVNTYLKQLMSSKEIPIEVLKFIAKNRGIEVANFYEMLRRRHNQKKSVLYTNIVKDQDNISDILITLSSLLTQIALYAGKLENPAEFYKEVRVKEITKCLATYYETGDDSIILKLIQVIKNDLLVMEYIGGRRDLIQ